MAVVKVLYDRNYTGQLRISKINNPIVSSLGGLRKCFSNKNDYSGPARYEYSHIKFNATSDRIVAYEHNYNLLCMWNLVENADLELKEKKTNPLRDTSIIKQIDWLKSNNNYIIISREPKNVSIMDLSRGEEIVVYSGIGVQNVSQQAHSPFTILLADQCGEVIQIDIRTNKETTVLRGNTNFRYRGLDLNPIKKNHFTIANNKRISVYDLRHMTRAYKTCEFSTLSEAGFNLSDHRENGFDLKYTSNGSRILFNSIQLPIVNLDTIISSEKLVPIAYYDVPHNDNMPYYVHGLNCKGLNDELILGVMTNEDNNVSQLHIWDQINSSPLARHDLGTFVTDFDSSQNPLYSRIAMIKGGRKISILQ